LDQLGRLVQAMETAVARGEQFHEIAAQFHFLVAARCGNSVVGTFLNRTIDAMSVKGLQLRQNSPPGAVHGREAYMIHLRLYQAIKSGSGAQIARAVSGQMDWSRRQLGLDPGGSGTQRQIVAGLTYGFRDKDASVEPGR
jgi:DNA-binding GntR family transcriptional regulator